MRARVWALSLLMVASSPPSGAAQHVAAEESGVIASGARNCVVCHGGHVEGGRRASVYNLKIDADRIVGFNLNNPSDTVGLISQSCLRCHSTADRRERQPDVAKDKGQSAPPGLLGNDMSDDHPMADMRRDRSPSGARFAIGQPVAGGSQSSASMPVLTSTVPARIECTTCHDPHSSFGAPKTVEEQQVLCLGCHNSSTYSGGGHSTLSCSTCHGLHNGQPGLVLLKSASREDLCGACHGNAVSVDVRMEEGLVLATFGHLEQPEEPCEQCHEVHF